MIHPLLIERFLSPALLWTASSSELLTLFTLLSCQVRVDVDVTAVDRVSKLTCTLRYVVLGRCTFQSDNQETPLLLQLFTDSGRLHWCHRDLQSFPDHGGE